MKNQCHCSCPERGNVLLPRILASGREWMRRQCVQIALLDIPDCAQSPFTLLSVEQCGQVEAERMGESCQRGQMLFLLKIPVTANIRDARGCMYTAVTMVETRAAVNMRGHMNEMWCSQIMAFASVRLVNCPPPAMSPCFEAMVELCAEVYLVRFEPCQSRACQGSPPCPDLPLYPQLPQGGWHCDCG